MRLDPSADAQGAPRSSLLPEGRGVERERPSSGATAKRSGVLLAALLASLVGAASAHAHLVTGRIVGWEDSGPEKTAGDCRNAVRMWWSWNRQDRGFFYDSWFKEADDSAVARATGVSDVSEISDASAFDFERVVGPACDADCATNGVGEFLIFTNTETGFYGGCESTTSRRTDPSTRPGGSRPTGRRTSPWAALPTRPARSSSRTSSPSTMAPGSTQGAETGPPSPSRWGTETRSGA